MVNQGRDQNYEIKPIPPSPPFPRKRVGFRRQDAWSQTPRFGAQRETAGSRRYELEGSRPTTVGAAGTVTANPVCVKHLDVVI